MSADELIQAKLFGAGLVPIDTEPLISRYNECLAELGIEPTKQAKISIDGMGWSPEVAEERKDMFYLSAGPSNQMAIIITPNQRNKPIYFPFHSYDRHLMETYFSRYSEEIADVTASRGLSLDIDQELTTYESPADLRLVDYIIVRTSSGLLGSVAKKQQALVEKLLEEGDAWADGALRAEAITSAAAFGDLRFRKIDIADLRFDDLKTFFTKAFGGVFVIQTLDRRCKLLVFDDVKHVPAESWKRDMYSVTAPETLELFIREKLLEVNLAWYQSYPQALAYLKDCLTAEILCANDPDLELGELNLAQRKKRLVLLGEGISDVYHELERLMKQLQSTALPEVDHLSPELRLLLLRPNRELPLLDQQVIRQFLHRLRSIDILQLYADDKELFSEQYKSWSKSKKAWAVQKISQDYILERS